MLRGGLSMSSLMASVLIDPVGYLHRHDWIHSWNQRSGNRRHFESHRLLRSSGLWNWQVEFVTSGVWNVIAPRIICCLRRAGS